MPPLDHHGYDQQKALQVFLKLASVALGLLVPPALSFHDVRRLVRPAGEDEEELEPRSDGDPLAPMLCEAAARLSVTVREGNVDKEINLSASLATLFDGEVARSLKPRLYAALDLRGDGDGAGAIVGLMSVCEWARDASLGTERFSQSFCAAKGLPRFDARWLFVDAVSASRTGAGSLMLLACYATLVARRSSRYAGLCAVCTTARGRKLFEALGFETFAFRDDGVAKTLAYAASLDMEHVRRRVRFDGATALLRDVCFRLALRGDSLVGRC